MEMTLRDGIEQHVDNVLASWVGTVEKSKKSVDDPIYRTFVLSPHELYLLNCPLIQRLRWIHQSGLAYLVYPTANHSRFEHALGTCMLADKFWKALEDLNPRIVDDTDRQETRIAALLHDVGQLPFSHVSEELISSTPQVRSEYVNKNSKFAKCSPHEILSYFVVSTKAFRDLFNDLMTRYRLSLDIENIAKMIIGNTTDPKDQWKADIINGVFDADVLDEMLRDSYFSGLPVHFDIERFLNTLQIRQGESRRIVSGVEEMRTIEQIMFNKLLLHSAVYNHHAVRASECMIKSALEYFIDEKESIHGRVYSHPADLLALTDNDILENQESAALSQIGHCVKTGHLYKRAIVISRQTVTGESLHNLLDLLKLKNDALVSLRKLIAERVGSAQQYHHIWIDLPETPSVREAVMWEVQITPGTYRDVNSIFPLAGWLAAYAESKWTGHVFCFPDRLQAIFEAARETFEDLFDIEFTANARLDQRPEVSPADRPPKPDSSPQRSCKPKTKLQNPFAGWNRTPKQKAISSGVFVVHGRDTRSRLELELMLREFGLRPIVLSEQPEMGRTIIEKLEQHASNVGFAFVLLTPDDVASYRNRQASRARQNVILEYGLFVGLLGRKRICCLLKGDLELPSDMQGIAYIRFTKSLDEIRHKIAKELRAADYKVDL